MTSAVAIVDASIVAAWLLPDEDGAVADALLSGISEGEAFAAPWLFWAELRNILIVNERRNRLTREAVAEFLAALRDLPIQLDSEPIEAKTLELARRHQLSVYDALYLELAMRLGRPLVSLDRKLSAAASVEGAV